MDIKGTVVSVCSGASEYSLVNVTVNFMGFLDVTNQLTLKKTKFLC